jgi:DNA mismatch repair ATPase MutS
MIPLQATAQLALAVESWRRAVGPAVLRWMAAVGEVEALSSLATFHFEHPDYPFPTIVDGEAGAPAPPGHLPVHLLLYDTQGLGHPLIPAARRVVNDLRLGGERRLILVSGSNMSGKSTLLRTVGVNAVLALAGAPVCARRLTLSPLALGATLRINDSLQAGKSRFYAELTRLKQIVDRAAGTPPLLFLLDEILHGTNSHDRRIGAEAIIRGLIDRGAVGLVTTHDLALAEVAEALGARAANVHFEDHLEGGVMTFDYRMKEGIVRKSNALELMRAVGLEV